MKKIFIFFLIQLFFFSNINLYALAPKSFLPTTSCPNSEETLGIEAILKQVKEQNDLIRKREAQSSQFYYERLTQTQEDLEASRKETLRWKQAAKSSQLRLSQIFKPVSSTEDIDYEKLAQQLEQGQKEKDARIEDLSQQVKSLQAELEKVRKENEALKENQQKQASKSSPGTPTRSRSLLSLNSALIARPSSQSSPSLLVGKSKRKVPSEKIVVSEAEKNNITSLTADIKQLISQIKLSQSQSEKVAEFKKQLAEKVEQAKGSVYVLKKKTGLPELEAAILAGEKLLKLPTTEQEQALLELSEETPPDQQATTATEGSDSSQGSLGGSGNLFGSALELDPDHLLSQLGTSAASSSLAKTPSQVLSSTPIATEIPEQQKETRRSSILEGIEISELKGSGLINALVTVILAVFENKGIPYWDDIKPLLLNLESNKTEILKILNGNSTKGQLGLLVKLNQQRRNSIAVGTLEAQETERQQKVYYVQAYTLFTYLKDLLEQASGAELHAKEELQTIQIETKLEENKEIIKQLLLKIVGQSSDQQNKFVSICKYYATTQNPWTIRCLKQAMEENNDSKKLAVSNETNKAIKLLTDILLVVFTDENFKKKLAEIQSYLLGENPQSIPVGVAEERREPGKPGSLVPGASISLVDLKSSETTSTLIPTKQKIEPDKTDVFAVPEIKPESLIEKTAGELGLNPDNIAKLEGAKIKIKVVKDALYTIASNTITSDGQRIIYLDYDALEFFKQNNLINFFIRLEFFQLMHKNPGEVITKLPEFERDAFIYALSGMSKADMSVLSAQWLTWIDLAEVKPDEKLINLFKALATLIQRSADLMDQFPEIKEGSSPFDQLLAVQHDLSQDFEKSFATLVSA